MSFIQVGSSYGVSKEATTATGATVTPNYGNSANQAGPTGPAGGIMAGNQTTPGSSGGQSFGSAGYGEQVGNDVAQHWMQAAVIRPPLTQFTSLSPRGFNNLRHRHGNIAYAVPFA